MLSLNAPYALLILLVIPLLLIFNIKRNKSGIKFSSTQTIKKVKKSARQQLSFIPLLLRIMALIFLSIALARPQMGQQLARQISRGIAIEMVVDRSGSMQLKKDIQGKSYNRLDIVKKVFKEFIIGNQKQLAGRPNDLIGLVVFARYADTICPLTLSHGALLKLIEPVKIVTDKSEDGTSIGDAIALAAARLQQAEAALSRQTGRDEPHYEIKSKIIILLTDGEDTGVGKRTPLQAALLAKKWGIKIYTIGLQGKDWYYIQDDPFFGRQKIPYQSAMNSGILEKIAAETGGTAAFAQDIQSLRAIYQKIDQLEKSELESVQYTDYKEIYFPFLLAALILICLEIMLRCTFFRSMP